MHRILVGACWLATPNQCEGVFVADCTPNATAQSGDIRNTIPFVDIDTNSDGLPDFEVRGTKLAGTDVLVAATVNLHAPADSPPVQVLPVNGQYGDVDSGVFDSTGPALFDAVRPGLWAQGAGDPALSYLARPGTALMVNRDATAAGA